MEHLTVKEICRKIWRLEEKFDLLNRDIQGVKVWQSIRMKMYYEIAEKTGVFSTPHPIKNSAFDRMRALPSFLLNSLIKNPLKGSYFKKYLIFDHPRKISVNGNYIDIYTKYLIDNLDNTEFDVIENSYHQKHFMNNENNRRYLDILNLKLKLLLKIKKVHFSAEERQWIETLQNQLFYEFGIKLDLPKIMQHEIISFKIQYSFYDKLIKKRNPQKIFVVISYYNMPLIAVAKSNNVQVIELQHGTISKYHLGYSYPNYNKELEYFPHRLLTFGEYWNSVGAYPISGNDIQVYGFPYMRNNMKQFYDFTKVKRQILFLSQGVIGEKLSRYVVKVAEKLPEYKIIYKLHPSEFNSWKTLYPELVKASKLRNVQIVDDNTQHLYSYLSQSEYQIGVFSTAIYEGLSFNCKTILVDLPGIEYMDDLVEKSLVYKAKTYSEIVDIITQLKGSKINKFNDEYFFASHTLNFFRD